MRTPAIAQLERVDAGPTDPISAVMHRDPYPYYASLRTSRPLYFDDGIGAWVASSAGAVREALSNPALRVRPANEPVPPALDGTQAGEIFSRLARMTDGPCHDAARRVAAGMMAWTSDAVRAAASRWAARCAQWLPPDERFTDYALRLPPSVVASLLGCADDTVPLIARLTVSLSRGLAPGSSPGHVAEGVAAASELWLLMSMDGGLAEGDLVTANRIGLLVQSCEATAALIASSVLALRRDARPLAPDTAAFERFAAEVNRFDAPVQNTRRFVSAPVAIAGQLLAEGDVVLLLLGAANRDASHGPEVDVFNPCRASIEHLANGAGPHACPGAPVSAVIAGAALMQLRRDGFKPSRINPRPAYRLSHNVRFPLITLESHP